jgi:hypothetical protein
MVAESDIADSEFGWTYNDQTAWQYRYVNGQSWSLRLLMLEHERDENRKEELKCLSPLLLDIRWRCLTVNSRGGDYCVPCQLVPSPLKLYPSHTSGNCKVILVLAHMCNSVMVVRSGIGEVRGCHHGDYEFLCWRPP